MIIDPRSLIQDWQRLEDIEKATLRLVVQAIWDFRLQAKTIFDVEGDLVADIGEDITREALDKMGMSRIDQRLFGKIDYKRARYIFHPDYALRQALFVDSKAEKLSGKGTATLQTSQLSMIVRQHRSGNLMEITGKLPTTLNANGQHLLTTTIFIKYNYQELTEERKMLKSITIAALPSGYLQEKYNPTVDDTIFIAGRNAPTLGEGFRVRLSFARLKQKAAWRVQEIDMEKEADFEWAE